MDHHDHVHPCGLSSSQCRNLTLTARKVTVQCMQDLYSHGSIRAASIEDVGRSSVSAETTLAAQPPLLDGFLMESMRTNCFQSTAVHRTALIPFRFSDGHAVPQGESVQLYREGIHFDDGRHQQPNLFNPWRYRESRRTATDVAMDWPFWGVGKHAWSVLLFIRLLDGTNICSPGRFGFSFWIKAYSY